MICPRCRVPLNRVKSRQGISYRCPKCEGRAVSVTVLRRVGAKSSVRELWRQAHSGGGVSGADCPVCNRSMTEVPLYDTVLPLRLDVCTRCGFVWFDTEELKQFPSAAAEKAQPLPEKVREMIAVQDLRRAEAEAERAAYDHRGPDQFWHVIPALFGLPVEEKAPVLA
ncbi:MAG: zf-TFIIB domain-containing protein, partial [Pirellulales bacterium]|nr:zf-TFIIB domain-containing protein [Pirellulales bacterium]